MTIYISSCSLLEVEYIGIDVAANNCKPTKCLSCKGIWYSKRSLEVGVIRFILEVQWYQECRIYMLLLYNDQSVDFSFLCFIASLLQDSCHSSRYHFSIPTSEPQKKDVGKMAFLSESYSYLSTEIISPQISALELPFMSFYLELKFQWLCILSRDFHGYAYYQKYMEKGTTVIMVGFD